MIRNDSEGQLYPDSNLEEIRLPENPFEPGAVENVVNLQWYEKDPERLEEETDLLNQFSPQTQANVLSDGRISFNLNIENHPVAFVLGHSFPLSPPEIVLADEHPLLKLADEEGKLDVLTLMGFSWNPSLNVVSVAQLTKGLMGLYKKLEMYSEELN